MAFSAELTHIYDWYLGELGVLGLVGTSLAFGRVRRCPAGWAAATSGSEVSGKSYAAHGTTISLIGVTPA